MDKIVSRILRQRETWWKAFKAGCRFKGYEYDKFPGQIKYRFPAPGSVPQTQETRFFMYKQHYTTPFRDSDFNIRPKDKQPPPPQMLASHVVDWDTDDPDMMQVAKNPLRQQQDKIKKPFDYEDPEAAADELREQFSQEYQVLKEFYEDIFKGVDPDCERAYNPAIEHTTERVTLGYEHLPEFKLMRIEMDKIVEDRIIKKRRKQGVLHFYRGNTRRWMVGDDHIAEDQKQLIQNAIQAPSPEDLRQWETEGKKPMALPINNENVSKWRDKPLATDSADFSPTLIQYDMDRAKKSYFERYEEPKQIGSS